MLAYHNNEAIRAKFLDRVNAHAKADEIIKGTYWEDGKGCAFGCMFHSSDHMLAETEAGIPVMLARLQDTIFDGLKNVEAKKWVVDFLITIKTGQDLSLVGWKFLHWLQTENIKRAIEQKMPDDVVAVIKQCADVLVPLTKGEAVDESAARSLARSAARSAASAMGSADIAAWSAARSLARSAASAMGSADIAAWSATWSAARSVESAAWSVESAAWSARSVAESAARRAAYKKMADKLFELIANAPFGEAAKQEDKL